MRMKPRRSRKPLRPREDAGLLAAIQKAGTINALAEATNGSQSAVSQWERIPEKWVTTIAKRFRLPRHVLRPDLYDAPRRRAS